MDAMKSVLVAEVKRRWKALPSRQLAKHLAAISDTICEAMDGRYMQQRTLELRREEGKRVGGEGGRRRRRDAERRRRPWKLVEQKVGSAGGCKCLLNASVILVNGGTTTNSL
jgi:hypothetical protein